MWNEFLNESRSEHKFQNTNLIILGSKHSGKRSLIDSLLDISKTNFHSKRLAANAQGSNKMRSKGVTTAIDYAYLNVLDLNDLDYRTHTKLEVYMIQDSENAQIYKQLSNPKVLEKAVIIVMLDFNNPWNFMSELDKWVKFIYELQKNAGFTITQLENLKNKVEDYYRNFKEPQFDEYGKPKRKFETEENDKITLPIPDGVLTANLRMPFILCINKCDLQSSVLRDESANKIMFVLYHLRKFCIQYGGTLIYTSIKNNSNLTLLYEYILHRSYNMPLRFKPQSISEENIFIPLGFDNLNLLNDSILKMDVSKSYEEVITPPIHKKIFKEETIVEEDSKFFQKYATTSVNTGTTIPTVKQTSQQPTEPTHVTKFFQSLLSKGGNSSTNLPPEDRLRRNNAEKLLIEKAALIDQKKQDEKQ